MRVLVVEDEHKIADFIRKGLTEHGYAVDVAFDGEEALDWQPRLRDVHQRDEADDRQIDDRRRYSAIRAKWRLVPDARCEPSLACCS